MLTQGCTRAICSIISQSILADSGPSRSSPHAACVHVSLAQPGQTFLRPLPLPRVRARARACVRRPLLPLTATWRRRT
eukprot:4126509-Alexandrium_andersonii.AAC.1